VVVLVEIVVVEAAVEIVVAVVVEVGPAD